MRYHVDFTRESRRHFEGFSARDRATLRDALVQQLTHEPTRETRHRKRMRPNTLAGWRLRVGELRVYYDVHEEDALVVIQAIGIKRRDRVYVGGEEINL